MRPLALVLIALALPANASASGGWRWPVDGEVITLYRNGDDPYSAGQHRGIDVAAAVGTPVVAATAGTIAYAGTVGSSGLVVSLRSADGRHVLSYLHLSAVSVQRGDEVAAGGRVGAVGVSGQRSAERPHLHFGVREAGERHAYLDPLRFLTQPPVEAPQPRPVPAPAPVADPVRPEPVAATAPATAPVPLPGRASLPALGPAPAPAPGGTAARSLAAPAAPRAAPEQRAATEARPDSGPFAEPHKRAVAAERPAAAPGPNGSGGIDGGWLAACAGLIAASALLSGSRGARRGHAPVRTAFGALLRAGSRG